MDSYKEDTEKTKIICRVCPHECALEVGQTGMCRGRVNKDGMIKPLNYGYLTALALDPIEKKPLARFMSGSSILSVGSFGCNMRCSFCQNYEISQTGAGSNLRVKKMNPKELVELALELQNTDNNIGIAFTYNEPLIDYEFVRDTARLSSEQGLVNVVVTNGCINQDILEEVLPYIDAFNVDLKAYTKEAYKSMAGDLDTVKNFIEKAAQKSHVEVTSLIVPSINDTEEDMEREARWLSGISPEIVLHITRFFPRYKMDNAEPTDIGTMKKLKETALKYLKYVYLGNV
ncbi:MAG: AmmeMemoRadiSam system radical SAM enzyme [Butyrivibrio sp.]|nr:AmmeMemoRadiSam system radical SAM enzyme [Butyrivibrio sp.]